MSGLVLEVQIHRLQGEDLKAGGSVILTFGAGDAKKRTNPITLTGPLTVIESRLLVDFPNTATSLQVELHSIVGENKTRIIGKSTLKMTGVIFPRMSGGRSADETMELKGANKGGGVLRHQLDISLSLKSETEVVKDEGSLELNRERIKMAMKKQEIRSRLRSKVDGDTKKYDGYRRNNDRMIALEAVRGYNLPEDFSTDEKKGSLVRVKSGNNGALSRYIKGSRHPGYSQALQIHVTGSFSIAIEDREDLNKCYAMAPLPIREFKVGKSYLTDIQIGEEGIRLLSVFASQMTFQEQLNKLQEDEFCQHLEIESLSLIDHPIVARFRLIRDTDDVYLDWNDSDGHDAEIEPFQIKITNEGVDEDAFNELKEKDEEEEAEGIIQQVALLPALSVQDRNAPPPKSVGFTGQNLGNKWLLVELFTPEMPERDEDTNVEAETDAPAMVFLAACIVNLEEVQAQRETKVKKEEIQYRELDKEVELRISEEISEVLPAGLEFPKKFKWKLRLWDGAALARRMEAAVNAEKDQKMGFDTWMSQLKLVTVEELIFKEAREAIINRSYELLQQQTDHVLPDIETKYFVTVDQEDKAAFSHSLPVSPTSIRPKDKKRPVTQDVARRLARPEVPTRPTTPVTYTQEEVDKMIARAVAQVTDRLNNKMDKERKEMFDRIDSLANSLRSFAEEKKRFQVELDERSEAIRKCGVEIMQLRTHVKQAVADKSHLQQQLKEKEQRDQELLNIDEGLEMLDRGDLEHRLKLLSASYKEEKGKAGDLLVKMKEMHDQLLKMEELNRAYKSLQEAHSIQNNKIKELQDKKNKFAKYAQTVQQQEEVIEKLEEMMEKAIQEAREAKTVKEQRDTLKNQLMRVELELEKYRQLAGDRKSPVPQDSAELEEARTRIEEQEKEIAKLKANPSSSDLDALKAQLQSLQEEKDALQKQLETAEKRAAAPKREGEAMGEKERLQLLMRAEKAEARVKAVEKQLGNNSKTFAKEISGLKMQLMKAQNK